MRGTMASNVMLPSFVDPGGGVGVYCARAVTGDITGAHRPARENNLFILALPLPMLFCLTLGWKRRTRYMERLIARGMSR